LSDPTAERAASRLPAVAIAGELGSGASGRVWRGVLLEPFEEWPRGSEVAVKVLRPELARDPAARRAFQLEAEALLSVRDPGLVRALAAGEDERGPFLVMQLVPGETLREALARRGPFPEPQLRGIAAQLAGGLASLHAAGYVHGDVKPENMRLDSRGRAVLLDLGFARALGEREATSRDAGSLAWLAPERARGGPATPASDVFALGAVLYELACGVHPFAPSPTAGAGSYGGVLRRSIEEVGADRLLAAILEARFVPPSRQVPQLSPFLDHLLQELLRRDPAQRPSAAELFRRLVEQESGAWWRARLDFGARGRRGVMGEARASHLTPLVGRERELETLLARWREVAIGWGGGAVWLVGPEGSGKSRLCSDFAARARAEEDAPLYLYGRCSAVEAERPCASVLRLVERWLRLPPGSPPTERERERIARSVPPAEAEALVQALSADLAETTVQSATPLALAHWLAALGREGPLLVFLDDLNFADEGTLEVLARLGGELARTRLLLVLGEREHEAPANPEAYARLRAQLGPASGALEVRLEPLTEEAVLELVTALFHHSAPRLRLARVLWDRSRGNPGLVSELLRGLIQRGDARPRAPGESELVLAVEPDRLPLPASLPKLIEERLRRLSREERLWLQRLAVVAGRIDAAFLVRAFPPTEPAEVDGVLSRLAQKGWLVAAGDRYRFARPALREAVYRSTAPRRRVRYHALAARALARAGGTDAQTDAERQPQRLTLGDAFQRAFHLRAAGEHAALLRLLPPLIAALLRRGQPQRVHALARWGLEALDSVKASRQRDRQRIAFLEAAADAADRLGYRADQRQWLDHLSDMELSPERDPEALARVYLLHGRYAVSTGQYGLARGMLRNAVELAQRVRGARELQSEALRRLAAVQAHVGELREARELAEAARAGAAHRPQESVALLQLATIALLDDDLEGALRSASRALALLRGVRGWHLPGIQAAGHMLRGRIYRLLGLPARALGSMSRAVRLARQAGERRLELEAGARQGGLLLDLDRPDEAEERLREALRGAGEIEDRRGQTLAAVWLGTLLWEQSDPEAASMLARAARLANEMGLGRAEAMALALRARVEREAGRTDAALDLTSRAAALLDRHGAELADRIVITGTRALVLHAAGQAAEASDLVKDLRRRLRRENARIETPDLRRTHRQATTRLLEAVLSPEGPIYPRVRMPAPAPRPA
jgi:hypothetical protein